ncbi:uncharacterized protein LOC114860742 isoform X2 [Betta splendens]|uniref:Uncharacterized protein LOC114860742 isoform X2 n=1 Tax=Betta splendens TaxID=158456 RepID=A0A6P7N792_BETSP|nr:uncharacterized protein LOC114860742 isoform X2 [Betta splendens]
MFTQIPLTSHPSVESPGMRSCSAKAEIKGGTNVESESKAVTRKRVTWIRAEGRDPRRHDKLGFADYSRIMTSWRYAPYFFLLVLLIDLSKEECEDYFDFSKDKNLAHNLTRTFPLVKPKNTTDLLQCMGCTLKKSKGRDKQFPYILKDCFESVNAESCSNETFGNISYYNLMCLTAKALELNSTDIKACHFGDSETLFKLPSLQYYATTLLPQTTSSTSARTKTTTTTSSKTIQTMLPTTKTATPQKTNTRAPNKTQKLLPTSAATTEKTAAQTASYVRSSDNLKSFGSSSPPQEIASSDNVLKYFPLSMGLILLLLTIVYLYKSLKRQITKWRENNAENCSVPQEPITQPRVAKRNEEEGTQFLDDHRLPCHL